MCALSTWLILAERLYASFRFQTNAELSKALLYTWLYVAVAFSLFIILVLVALSEQDDAMDVTGVARYCDLMFYGIKSYLLVFLFYLVGEVTVLFWFVWIKRKSLQEIENFRVNCKRSKLETRFQLKKNIEVTKAVLPQLVAESCAGLVGLMIAVYVCLSFPGNNKFIMIVEILCYVVAPAYFAVYPIILMWNVPKLTPKMQIGQAPASLDDIAIKMLGFQGHKSECQLRLKALEEMWNKKFDQNAVSTRKV